LPQANQTAAIAILKQYDATTARVSYLRPETGKCEKPPFVSNCTDNGANLALGASKWGCLQNNFYGTSTNKRTRTTEDNVGYYPRRDGDMKCTACLHITLV
jgi:hypothetical protein